MLFQAWFFPGFPFKDKAGFTNNVTTNLEHQQFSSPDATNQEDKIEITSTMYNKLVALLSQSEASNSSAYHQHLFIRFAPIFHQHSCKFTQQ